MGVVLFTILVCVIGAMFGAAILLDDLRSWEDTPAKSTTESELRPAQHTLPGPEPSKQEVYRVRGTEFRGTPGQFRELRDRLNETTFEGAPDE